MIKTEDVQAVADYLTAAAGPQGDVSAVSGDTLLQSLVTLATSLATAAQQEASNTVPNRSTNDAVMGALNATRNPAALVGAALLGTGTAGVEDKQLTSPADLEALNDGIQMFSRRYPMDARAYDYLVTSPAMVVAHVLRDFRPQQEGEADYSKLVTTYVKRIRQEHGQEEAAPSSQRRMMVGAWQGDQRGSGAARPWSAHGHGQLLPGRRNLAPPPKAAVSNFFLKYPVDERAQGYFGTCSPEIQQKVLLEFQPSRIGQQDYSPLLTSFIKKCLEQVGQVPNVEKHVRSPMVTPALGTTVSSTGPPPEARVLPPGGAPPDLESAAQTPGLDQFLANYPLDERAYDFFASSSLEVQAKVLQEFQPIREGEANYSGLFTSFVKKCRTNVGEDISGPPPARLAMPETEKATPFVGAESLEQGFGGLSSLTSLESKEPLDLEGFRLRFPMDERAFDYLSTAPQEVQERVLDTFVPQRLNDTDFSAAVTAYVRALRKELSEVVAASTVTDESIEQFFLRYPCDVRAVDYFQMCSLDVQAQVLREFRPRSEGDADYSGAVTAFIKRCRGHTQERMPPLGGWGPRHQWGSSGANPHMKRPRLG